MILPEYILTCINALEAAGYSAYAVGGCVRDSLLGITPQDYDLCTDAVPEQIRGVFSDYRLVLAGEKHGTVTVVMPEGLVEITTFRQEGGYKDNRHPDWVRFVANVEDDLSRRDFTVNAMAYSPTRGFADPFGGREDLGRRQLRAVGDPTQRFTEDALRILRGIRFAVRYDLSVAPETLEAMFSLAPSMESLAKERVFSELCKFLSLAKAADIVRFFPILAQVIPELAPLEGFDQHSPYHAYDLLTHTAHVLAGVPPQLPVRWAALLHDIGKPGTFTMDENGRGHFLGHAALGAEMADNILHRLKAPTALRRQVTDLIARHMTPLEPDKPILRRRLGKYGVEETLQLLSLQRADFSSKGTGQESDFFDRIGALIQEIQREAACLRIKDLAVNGNDIVSLGCPPGPKIGACLEHLLALVQEDAVPNEKTALMQSAAAYLAEVGKENPV